MKKQVKKISLKTDKIVNLSNIQAQNVKGGRWRPNADSKFIDTRPTCL
jgi:hypothetical protein